MMIALESYVKNMSNDYFIDLLEEIKDNSNDQLILYKADNVSNMIINDGYTDEVKVKIIELKDELDSVSRFEPDDKDVIGQQQLIF